MYWLIFAAGVLLLLSMGRIEARISTVRRRRVFYFVDIYYLGIRVYHTVLMLRFKNYVDPQLLVVRPWGYALLTDIAKARDKRRRGESLDTGFLLRSLKVDEGKVSITVGTGDAAQTAVASQLGAMAVDAALRLCGIMGIEVCPCPDFEKVTFSVRVDCILSSFAAQIISEYFKQKGGIKKCTR